MTRPLTILLIADDPDLTAEWKAAERGLNIVTIVAAIQARQVGGKHRSMAIREGQNVVASLAENVNIHVELLPVGWAADWH